jgi:hypothetical protein
LRLDRALTTISEIDLADLVPALNRLPYEARAAITAGLKANRSP